MDKITISDLFLDAIIGVHAWERQVKQKLRCNIELCIDISKAAAEDDIKFTVNYNDLINQLQAFVANTEFKLIETLAERTAQFINEKFSVTKIKLSIAKLGILPQTGSVTAEIEREFFTEPKTSRHQSQGSVR